MQNAPGVALTTVLAATFSTSLHALLCSCVRQNQDKAVWKGQVLLQGSPLSSSCTASASASPASCVASYGASSGRSSRECEAT